MARRLFGTDGVRGVAGELLTADLAVKLGRAATLQSGAQTPRVLLIRDTRESGEMLEAALGAGVTSAGGDVYLGGVLPTPAAPLLVGRYGFDLAAVISASHNPYRDNGIKFFGADGFKLSDATEEAIEERLDDAPGGGQLVEQLLDRLLGGIGQLVAVGSEELDPVVAGGVVAGTDDRCQIEAVAGEQQRCGGRRQYAPEKDVAPGRGHAGSQRRL